MWTFFIRECLGAAVLAVATGAVFGLGEFLRRTGAFSPEQSRKLLHIGGCATALLFPVLFHSHWTVLAICGGFFLLILWLSRRGALHAVNDVERRSYGGILHPVALYLCYLLATFYDHGFAFYEIAILVLALSDTAAALVGERYGRLRYRVDGEDYRSLEGSFFFFLVTYALVQHILLLFLKMPPLEASVLAFMIGAIVTLFESVSLGGADNLAIPIAVMAILIKNAKPDLAVMTQQIEYLAGSVVVVSVSLRVLGVMQGSGRVVMALLVYLASGLHSPWWGLMTWLGVMAAHYSRTLRLAEVRTVFALAALPFLTVMGFNLAEKLGGWFDLRVSTPIYAVSLIASFLLVRTYEKR